MCLSLAQQLYTSGSLVRKIWNLVVPIHTFERSTFFASVQKPLMVFSARLSISVFVRLITSRYLNGIGECFFVWVVQLHSRFFMIPVNNISPHGPRTCIWPFLFVVFFGFIIFLIARKSPSAVDDGRGLLGSSEVPFTQGNLYGRFNNMSLLLILLWRKCLRLLILANVHDPRAARHQTILLRLVPRGRRKLLSAFSYQTNGCLTCLCFPTPESIVHFVTQRPTGRETRARNPLSLTVVNDGK